MSLTVDSQNGLQNSSRKIYYREKKANSFPVFILREFITKKMKKPNEISNSAFPRETKQV